MVMQLTFFNNWSESKSTSFLRDDFHEHGAVHNNDQNHQKDKRPWGQD